MKNKRTKNKLIYVFVSLLLIIIALIGGQGVSPALADSTPYTSVLTDLQKDEEFMTVDYPDNENDRSIAVISIAESADGGLFVYTYQPCQSTTYLVATQINMSITDKMVGEIDNAEDLSPEDRPLLYNLTLISCESVFCKYKVNGFTVRDKAVRYYNIVSIYRKWLDGDPESGNDNTIKSLYYRVGLLYKAETVDGEVKYLCKNVDVVEIKNPYVDFLSYYDGMTWGSFLGFAPDNFTDVHYIAFSTDWKIDTLKEADVTYTTQSYHYTGKNGEGFTYGEKSQSQYITVTAEMSDSSNGGFLAEKYTWKCIQRTSDFIKSAGIDEFSYAYENIKNTEFVLAFLTTPFTQRTEHSLMQGHYKVMDGTKVSDVAILRLLFETNGKTYNLGTLMNQIESDEIAGNTDKPVGFWGYIWRCILRLFRGTASLSEQIVAVIALFFCVLFVPILIIVLSFVFPPFGAVVKMIFKGICTGILWLLKGLWWLICLPFKGIKALINKIRGE